MNAFVLRMGINRETLTGMAGPVLIMLVLGMMVLPLPPFLLDLLFTFNIALAMIVLLTAMYTLKPLDFAVFPTLLLLTTLLRLSLNVASTRVVLLNGHTGPDAAGKVIEAFGQFLVGGNFAVGLVVFSILVVINFIVITKGAGRIAEVGARFTLDAMPGKQMAIDADLNAGAIGEEEARRRRAEVAEEADFYGAMDGSSKFVRGDAIAGVLILVINVVGGLIIGVVQHDLSLATATRNYVLLAIGDGLVAQIPALLISTAAGLVVSRVGKGQRMGEQLLNQLFAQPHALVIAAVVLGLLGLIPGMPNLAFLLLAGGLGFAARVVSRRKQSMADAAAAPAVVPAPAESLEVSWDDLVPVDALGLEVGYRLIPLVDPAKDGELLRRIKAIRKKFAQEIGFLPPSVHIRDNLELGPSAYRVLLNGVIVGEGECHVGMMLAIDPGDRAGTLPGIATKDPAFGLPAHWIEANQADQAHAMGCTVVDPGTVVATHLSTVVHAHAATLLGRQEVQSLLERAAKASPKLVEELTPKLLPLSTVHRVLQALLDEQVNIRDLRTVLETLADHAGRTQDVGELTAAVRIALGRAIVQQIFGTAPELPVITLDGELERVLLQVAGLVNGEGAVIEPGLADSLVRETGEAMRQQEALGHPAVLLVPDRLRAMLFRMLRRSAPALRVLAHGEIPAARTIRVTAIVGGKR